MLRKKKGFMKMEREEKITKLCEKLNVTPEEARNALDACNGDILDAVMYLETLGKVRTPKTATFTAEYAEAKEEVKKEKEPRKSESFMEAVGRFCAWVLKLIKAGCENFIDIEKDGDTKVRIPLIIPVLLLLPCFWLEAILLLVGFAFGLRYSFSGPAFHKDSKVNRFSAEASNRAEQLMQEFNRGFEGAEKKDDIFEGDKQ